MEKYKNAEKARRNRIKMIVCDNSTVQTLPLFWKKLLDEHAYNRRKNILVSINIERSIKYQKSLVKMEEIKKAEQP